MIRFIKQFILPMLCVLAFIPPHLENIMLSFGAEFTGGHALGFAYIFVCIAAFVLFMLWYTQEWKK